MGEYAGQENIEETQGQTGGDQEGTGGLNPAWNEVLNPLPQEFHSQITPHLQKWDQNFQNKIQEVHSQYEPYKGYEPFVQAGVTPDEMNYAYGLYNALNTNPGEFLAALQEAVGQETQNQQQVQFEQQGQYESTPQSPDFDIESHPYVQRLNGMVETMAQIFLGQKEQEEQQAYDQEFDQELQSLKETYGEYDEKYVIGLLMANPEMPTEDAVKQYKALEQQILSGKRQPGPPVLGSGGNIPNVQTDTRKMGGKDTRSIVAQMLADAAQQQ
jgi:hypothetical protein